MKLKDLIAPAIVALLAAAAAAIFGHSLPAVAVAAVVLAAIVLVASLFWLWRRFHPQRWPALLLVRFLISGLRTWAERTSRSVHDDPLWDWLTDQVFVIQRRYAFSIGCLAFGMRAGELCCLVVERDLGPLKDILLWPGGRVRGTDKDFEAEIRHLVERATGCTVHLLAVDPSPGAGFSEPVATYHSPEEGQGEPNLLLQPPILVMQENRTQTYGVPGHFDLLYIAQGDPSQPVRCRGEWMSLRDIDNRQPDKLWRDTSECIQRAADVYRRIKKLPPPP